MADVRAKLSEKVTQIEQWRFDCFREYTGGDVEAAYALTISNADLHVAKKLWEGGCPVDLMLRILT